MHASLVNRFGMFKLVAYTVLISLFKHGVCCIAHTPDVPTISIWVRPQNKIGLDEFRSLAEKTLTLFQLIQYCLFDRLLLINLVLSYYVT